MYKVSELLGKPLLSLSEAKILGTVANILFDEKMLKGVWVVLYDNDDETRYLPLMKLVNFESDAVVVKNADGLEIEPKIGLENPINSPVFNQDGKLLGGLRDIVMEGIKVTAFVLDDITVSSDKLLSAGSVLVFNDSGRSIKLTRPQKSAPEKEEKDEALTKKAAFAPSYDFLLGKKTQRNIFASDGKLIVHEGESITYSIIDTAKREGKLVILALNAL